jgi:hypothetical protein
MGIVPQIIQLEMMIPMANKMKKAGSAEEIFRTIES